MSDLDAARRWLQQADADLATAADIARTHPYAACFFAQQAAEKAVKALHLARTGTVARPIPCEDSTISWPTCARAWSGGR